MVLRSADLSLTVQSRSRTKNDVALGVFGVPEGSERTRMITLAREGVVT